MSRKIVIPGDELGVGKPGNGTYEEDEKIYSKIVGLADSYGDVQFVIPLNGIYNPRKGDGIIGRIEEVAFSKWIIDINSPYQAIMLLSEAVDEFIDLTKDDITKYFDIGDLIFAEVSSVSHTKVVQLSMKNRKCRKLRGGRILKVSPAKVPRIIGKSGSMVEMIKEKTGTQIVIGQNGIVWIKGEKEELAASVIHEIEEKSHINGLTDMIKQKLDGDV